MLVLGQPVNAAGDNTTVSFWDVLYPVEAQHRVWNGCGMECGMRHDECCVLAHDDIADILGLPLCGLLSGIIERSGTPIAAHGKANGVPERNRVGA